MLSVTTSEPEEKGGENEETQSSAVIPSRPEDKGEEKVLERLNSITQAHTHTHTHTHTHLCLDQQDYYSSFVVIGSDYQE